MDIKKLKTKIADLEAKLAESEEINKLVNEQLKDMERSKLSWENQWFTLYNTLKNYREANEQKLAEKEKRIKKLNYEAQKYYEDAYCNDFHNQDKISFAVEQIVKTKETLIEFLQDEGFYENEWYDLFEKIDNQIKQLTNQHEDKGE